MSPKLKWLLPLACAAIIVATPAAAGAHHYDHLLPKSGTCKGDRSPGANHERRNRAVACLANRARKRHGLKRLKTSSTLAGRSPAEGQRHHPLRQVLPRSLRSRRRAELRRRRVGPGGAENLGYGQRTAREASATGCTRPATAPSSSRPASGAGRDTSTSPRGPAATTARPSGPWRSAAAARPARRADPIEAPA